LTLRFEAEVEQLNVQIASFKEDKETVDRYMDERLKMIQDIKDLEQALLDEQKNKEE
jgi:hypothetical protein